MAAVGRRSNAARMDVRKPSRPPACPSTSGPRDSQGHRGFAPAAASTPGPPRAPHPRRAAACQSEPWSSWSSWSSTIDGGWIWLIKASGRTGLGRRSIRSAVRRSCVKCAQRGCRSMRWGSSSGCHDAAAHALRRRASPCARAHRYRGRMRNRVGPWGEAKPRALTRIARHHRNAPPGEPAQRFAQGAGSSSRQAR